MFKNHYLMRRHMKTHSYLKPFECLYSDCTHRSGSRNNLKTHIKTVHTKDRSFKCTVSGCNKSYAIQSHLKTHLTIHSNERLFKCSECDKTFNTKCLLAAHEKTHRTGTGLRPIGANMRAVDKCYKPDISIVSIRS